MWLGLGYFSGTCRSVSQLFNFVLGLFCTEEQVHYVASFSTFGQNCFCFLIVLHVITSLSSQRIQQDGSPVHADMFLSAGLVHKNILSISPHLYSMKPENIQMYHLASFQMFIRGRRWFHTEETTVYLPTHKLFHWFQTP